MKEKDKKAAEWMLTRQRFHIDEPSPPQKKRKERTITPILSDILKQEKPQACLPDGIKESWTLSVGSQIADHTDPVSIKNGSLLVNVDHPGWLTEIRRLPTRSILKKINTPPSLPEIREIHFRLDPSVRTKHYRGGK